MSRYEFSRFKQPPDDEFVCGICMNVLDNPKESPCRHVFCQVCITRALREKSSCPICRKYLQERHLKDVLPLVQNLLNKLQMECEHKDNGCPTTIPLEIYISHVEKCDFMMVTCKNALCNQRLLKRDCHHHESTECQFRTYVCDEGCECDVLCLNRDSHSCLQTLLLKYKEARERIDNLEEKVKELESRLHPRSPALDSIISSPSLSSLRLSLSYGSDVDRSPGISLSDCSDDFSILNDDDDEVPSDPEWPTSSLARGEATGDDYNEDGGRMEERLAARGLEDMPLPSRSFDASDIWSPLPVADDDEGGDVSNSDTVNGHRFRHDSSSRGRSRRAGRFSSDDSHDAANPGTGDNDHGSSSGLSSRRKRAGSSPTGGGYYRAAKRARPHGEGESSLAAQGEVEDGGDEEIRSAGPLRRSARLRNLPASPVDDSNDLRTPSTTMELLRLYNDPNDSSSDHSWSPSTTGGF